MKGFYENLSLFSQGADSRVRIALVLTACLGLAVLLRFDFAVEPIFWNQWVVMVFWLIPLKLTLLAAFSQFLSLLTYFGSLDAIKLALAFLHRCNYLLTWNCRHLANANKIGQIWKLNELLHLPTRDLVTPMELGVDPW